MPKELKKYNGRGQGKYIKGTMYIAAYNRSHAARLISVAVYGKENEDAIRPQEIRDYYAECWGNAMTGIEPTEPCVYVEEKSFSHIVKRIL